MSITSKISPAFRSGLGHPACASRGSARISLHKRHIPTSAHLDSGPADAAVPFASLADQPSSARGWLEENGPLAIVCGLVVAALGAVGFAAIHFLM